MSNQVVELLSDDAAPPSEWYAIYTRHKHEKAGSSDSHKKRIGDISPALRERSPLEGPDQAGFTSTLSLLRFP